MTMRLPSLLRNVALYPVESVGTALILVAAGLVAHYRVVLARAAYMALVGHIHFRPSVILCQRPVDVLHIGEDMLRVEVDKGLAVLQVTAVLGGPRVAVAVEAGHIERLHLRGDISAHTVDKGLRTRRRVVDGQFHTAFRVARGAADGVGDERVAVREQHHAAKDFSNHILWYLLMVISQQTGVQVRRVRISAS